MKKIIFTLCFIIIGAIGFTGCSFLNTTLQTPTVTMDKDAMVLNWTSVENAEHYDIYMDNNLVYQQKENGSISYNFNFSSLISDEQVHTFQVKAIAVGLYADSSFSRTLSYVGNFDFETSEEELKIAYSETISPKNVVLNGDIVQWDLIEDVTEYYVGVYTTSSGLTYYTTDSNFLLLSNLLEEECAIRVGVKEDNNTVYLNSNLIFYSPDDSGEFTNEFYLFDSQINDMYITTIEELNNLIYYKFIYRDEDYTFRVSSEINEQIENTYNLKNTFAENVKSATTYSFSRFMETMDYEYSSSGRASIISHGSNYVDVSVKISFKGVKECDTNLNASSTLEQDNDVSLPSYEVYNSDFVGEDLELVDQNWFLTTMVETSEQLYWAVENQIKPVFVNTTCRAYEIYYKAVDVLKNEIIKEGMTDYQKALAIFDWIEYNTVYDYTDGYSQTDENGQATGKFVYGETVTNAITSIPSYYLEGVFIKGVAVCDGFSKAYSLMCNLVGIECVRISGSIYEMGMYAGDHAWNKVKIGNQFYICDITWTPVTYDADNDNADDVEYLSHKYFMVNDEYLEQTHREFQYRTKYFSSYYDAPNMYSYYTEVIGTHYTSATDTTGVLIDRLITSNDDLNYTFEYVFNNDIESIEIVFSYEYYKSIENTISNATRFTETLKSSKIKCQYLQTMGLNIAYYGDDLTNDVGYMMLLSSTNLIDDTGEVDGEDDIIEMIQHLNNTGSEFKYKTYDIWVDQVVLEGYLLDGVTYAEAIQNWVNYLIENVYNDTNYLGLTYTNFEIVFDQNVNNGQPIHYELDNEVNTAYACTFKLIQPTE